MTLAAVLERAGDPLLIEDVDLEEPRAGEVKVRMGAAGVCHSDLSVLHGVLPNPMPVVLGHEGSGTVVSVGQGVTTLEAGDRVVVGWLAQCGDCVYCIRGQRALCEVATPAMARCTMLDGSTRFSRAGEPVFHMAGVGAFAEHCVVSENAAIKVPDTLAFGPAALLGCAVLTGFGAAVNSAAVAPGETVAVIGCGGVGLNAIQGARISGASEIIAIDPNQDRLATAEALGATRCMAPSDDLAKAVRKTTGGYGVDVAIEVVGRTETINTAMRISRRGGRVVLVGAGPDGARLDVPAFTGLVVPEKTVIGSFYGSAHIARDVTRLVELYASGALHLDELISQTFGFKEIHDALDYSRSGDGIRSLIAFE
jgi:Zn-dependent alcohol dehydrogenase